MALGLSLFSGWSWWGSCWCPNCGKVWWSLGCPASDLNPRISKDLRLRGRCLICTTCEWNIVPHRLLSQVPSAVGASRITLQVKVLTAKPVGLSLITGICTMYGGNQHEHCHILPLNMCSNCFNYIEKSALDRGERLHSVSLRLP